MILETGVSFVRVHLFVFYILVKGLNSRALASKNKIRQRSKETHLDEMDPW